MVLQHLYTEIVKSRPWEFISCHASFCSHWMFFAAGCIYSSPSHSPCSSSATSVVVSQSELGMGIKAEQWSIPREPASIPRGFIPGSCVLATNRSSPTACPGHGGSGSLALPGSTRLLRLTRGRAAMTFKALESALREWH